LVIKRRRWALLRRSLAIAKSCPSLTYEAISQCRRKSRLRLFFKRMKRHHKIFRSNFRNLRRGVTTRFIIQIPRRAFLSAHKASMYRKGLFVSLLSVNDDTVLLVSFTIFLSSLFFYYGNTTLPGYIPYTTELKSLLLAGEAQRISRLRRAIKIQLSPLLSYRKRLHPVIRAYVFYMTKVIDLFLLSQYSIMPRTLPRKLRRQIPEIKFKRIANSFLPQERSEVYQLLASKHLTSIELSVSGTE
jgi:hypothetical protein